MNALLMMIVEEREEREDQKLFVADISHLQAAYATVVSMIKVSSATMRETLAVACLLKRLEAPL